MSREVVAGKQEVNAVRAMFKETSEMVEADRNWNKVRE
jgi:hypothetical protein